MQAALDPLIFCVDPLTHSLTHTRKSADGRSGTHSIYALLILGTKAPESLEYQWINGSTRICNQQVGGSSPSTSSTTSYGRVPEWPKGADCKSVVADFGGSNPPSPTKYRVDTFVSARYFFALQGGIRKAALGGVPVARRNRRGVSRRKSESTLSHQKPECESVRVFTFYLLPIHYYLEPHSDFW